MPEMGGDAAAATVMVVDDEPALVEVLEMALTSRGYHVVVARTGPEALEEASVRQPDVLLLDLGIPDLDGVSVCRELRTWFANPIIVLTGEADEHRKVEALDAGADDYITKPFSTPELFARIRVALRHRRLVAAVVDVPEIHVGSLMLDLNAHAAFVDGRSITLTPKEFSMLVLLARNAGRLLVHASILGHVWGDVTQGTPESLRVHMTHLRKKLGSGLGAPRIVTEPGVGYRLVVPVG